MSLKPNVCLPVVADLPREIPELTEDTATGRLGYVSIETSGMTQAETGFLSVWCGSSRESFDYGKDGWAVANGRMWRCNICEKEIESIDEHTRANGYYRSFEVRAHGRLHIQASGMWEKFQALLAVSDMDPYDAATLLLRGDRG